MSDSGVGAVPADEPTDEHSELQGARATIEHMSEAMSWISGHDRQGLDHLEEAVEAVARAEAAEGRLAAVTKLARSEVARLETRNPKIVHFQNCWCLAHKVLSVLGVPGEQ